MNTASMRPLIIMLIGAFLSSCVFESCAAEHAREPPRARPPAPSADSCAKPSQHLRLIDGRGGTMELSLRSATLDEAHTIFIDGVTGFAFVWQQDNGWEFAGVLVD